MSGATAVVLNHQQIKDRVRRMAWQIYESHQKDSEITLAGIIGNGFLLAKMLQEELEKISSIQISLHKIIIDKKQPLKSQPLLEPNPDNLDGKSILVIDDVLNTGSTLIYGVKHFLEFKVRQIKTIVLVDRNHKNFPVKADIKGLSLSTSLMEHVEVQIENEPFDVTVS